MIPPWGRGSGRSGVESTRSIIHKRSHVFDLCLAFGPSMPPPSSPSLLPASLALSSVPENARTLAPAGSWLLPLCGY